jgi:serine-type D-Ala-D-Ala carboxypeptidase (penicillin-binding protein 5/6)
VRFAFSALTAVCLLAALAFTTLRSGAESDLPSDVVAGPAQQAGPAPALPGVGGPVIVTEPAAPMLTEPALAPPSVIAAPAPSMPEVSLLAAPIRVREADPPPVTAKYIAIVDEGSGSLLFEQGGDVRVPPASVTKIATTLVALQREPDLGRVIPITVNGPEMAAADGSQIIGLEPGERLRLETLLYGMMLWSGNDAAEQVAVGLADSRDRYVQWMNDLVTGVGLKNTHFANPSGMDANGHYSSAADMAYLARYAMRDSRFREMVSTRFYEAEGYPLANINRLLGNYPGVDGVKVGYTGRAHRTMVASATQDGHRVYVSIMRSEDLVSDETALLNWVWRTFRWE